MGAGAVDYSRLHHQNMHVRSVHAVVDEQRLMLLRRWSCVDYFRLHRPDMLGVSVRILNDRNQTVDRLKGD